MQTQQINDNQWKIAHDLASALHDSNTDVNEFGKVVAFMRRYQKTDNTIDSFWTLLQRMANSNEAFSRSNATPEYLVNIQESCVKHLKEINDLDELMCILGWCRRLMYYYSKEPKRAVEEQVPQEQKQIPEQPAKQSSFLKEEVEKPNIQVGKKYDAIILEKVGSEVKVQMQTDNKEELVFEQLYYPGQVGAKVKLKVMAVNESGNITKVIP